MKKLMKLFSTVMLGGLMFTGASATTAEPDSSLNLLDKGKIAEKMFQAKGKLNVFDYRGAINLYREVLQLNSQHVDANLLSGECHFALKRYDLALEYANKTASYAEEGKKPKDLDLLFGKVYQKLGEPDKAIEHLDAYRKAVSETENKEEDVDLMIAQCKRAKEMLANPNKDISVKRMGEFVNSPTDDFGLFPSPDGKTLYFTSRRSDTRGAQVDLEGDYKFFTDIYVCKWDSLKNKWTDGDNDLAGNLNSEYHESVNYISPDGNLMLIYRNMVKVTKSGDIFYAKRNERTGKWSKPKSFDKKTINTSFWESSACLTGDGNTVYFLSERLGGEGHSDIYYSTKVSGKWTQPETVGPNVNTIYDENTVYVTPDGRWMFFSSRGHDSMGGYDIFRSENQAGVWSKPVNLGAPINTVDDDLHFVLTADMKKAFMSTIPEHGKYERDVFEVDLSKVDILKIGN